MLGLYSVSDIDGMKLTGENRSTGSGTQTYRPVSLAKCVFRLWKTYRWELHDLEHPESESQVHNHHDQQSQYQQVEASLSPAIYPHSKVVRSPMTGRIFHPVRGQGTASQHPADKHTNITLKIVKFSWFQAFVVFCMLYAFFWVITRCLDFICRCFGTLCLFHLYRQVDVSRMN